MSPAPNLDTSLFRNKKQNQKQTANKILNEIQTLHQLEQELNVEIIPGTEVMRDVGSHHFVKSSGKSDRVLVPQPSEDPHDPLVGCVFGSPA